MIDLAWAVELRDAGLAWEPRPGDRFVLTAPEMAGELFHLASMVIEARQIETGTIFAFNGTTEWALDSVEQHKTVWLPTETQLRDALGSHFVALRRSDAAWEVRCAVDGQEASFSDEDPENAYAQALLAVLKARAASG